MNKNIKEQFRQKPVITFRRNKNLHDYTGRNNTVNKTKMIRKTKIERIGKCQTYLSRARNFCCKQIKSTTKSKVHDFLHM